jgi:hypothetical protein
VGEDWMGLALMKDTAAFIVFFATHDSQKNGTDQ